MSKEFISKPAILFMKYQLMHLCSLFTPYTNQLWV